ncbi:hypothetical protein [Sphaerisporangium sp. TRM90804]|uniref:hypothetical protein n=1 Tax=Sphaerisporangium sp. TRM90804 TaxID=3031113 RepID=UPI00244A0562|nr:hypothetical protein [Sphaerisporangium sp. TRM90804]MDH2425677.1 hypothetical protein [Sphaerisporangium sp. TRM90804]
MYGWIWRLLPGGAGAKTAATLALVIVAGVVLWYVVFPMLEPHVRLDSGTVGR